MKHRKGYKLTFVLIVYIRTENDTDTLTVRLLLLFFFFLCVGVVSGRLWSRLTRSSLALEACHSHCGETRGFPSDQVNLVCRWDSPLTPPPPPLPQAILFAGCSLTPALFCWQPACGVLVNLPHSSTAHGLPSSWVSLFQLEGVRVTLALPGHLHLPAP